MIEDGKEEEIGKKKKSKNSQGKDPKTFEENSHFKDPSTFEGSHQVERWRVQEKRKEGKRKQEKKMECRAVTWWKKCKELIMGLSLIAKERPKEEGRQKGRETPQSKECFGEVWKVALSLSDCGTELAVRERGSRWTTEKDGDSDEDAAGTASEGIQMDGGDFTKVEAAKRGRQN